MTAVPVFSLNSVVTARQFNGQRQQ